MKIILLITLIAAIFTSCSEYQKLLKSSDFELKYRKAKEYYEKKDYFRASALFEELINIYKGTARGEEVYYYYAYCQYSQEDFIMAAYHFRFFARNFPNSKHVEEAEYLGAYCIFLESPEYSLDQTYTNKAIEEFQYYIEKYPASHKIDTCNKLIDLLRVKLEKKAYMNATLYYQLSEYKAAITAIKNMLKDYPDSQYREELLYIIVKSSYLLAEGSVEKKKKERYQSTVNEYYALVDEFPNSKHVKEAEHIFESSTKKLKKL
ncbi:MAG: outer membrane protein assembly factor BamD [Bacteroidia bacterium]|nr:outer membrane protein assembly factor BamD [Bacteroidia bacterium]